MMAKVVLNNNLEDIMNRWLLANAEAAVIDYREQPLELDAADYPFERHPGERSIRDPASSSITKILNGVRIKIEARGAYYIEFGNDASGDTIESKGDRGLHLPLSAAGEAKFPEAEYHIERYGGRVFLVKAFVNAYKGTNRLRNAVRRAFNAVGPD